MDSGGRWVEKNASGPLHASYAPDYRLYGVSEGLPIAFELLVERVILRYQATFMKWVKGDGDTIAQSNSKSFTRLAERNSLRKRERKEEN